MELNKEILDKVRNIEGFPTGKDEDIIKLSCPPYYTACPNPFINEFIEKNGTPYDEEKDEYNVEPYTADVSEGKNDPIYNAHSYHTKVPYKAIMRYILHYTKPGDIVFDGFCGTGMTGVAAQMCNNPEPEFKLKVQKELEEVEWGTRRAILSDLSTIATFIAYNYNTPMDVGRFDDKANKILKEIDNECGWMYETIHISHGVPQKDISGNNIIGKINYTVWSDAFICPHCSSEIIFYEIALDKQNGQVKNEIFCNKCGAIVTKAGMERAFENIFDQATGEVIKVAKQVPVLINYNVGKSRYEKEIDQDDLRLIDKINTMNLPYWYPTNRIKDGEKTREPIRIGISHMHLFYTKRNLYVLSALWKKGLDSNFSTGHIMFLFEQVVWGMSKMARYVPTHYSQVNQYLSGTLYIGSQVVEVTPRYILENKIKSLKNVFNRDFSRPGNVSISTNSNTNLLVGDNSVDYIFTDPPFGDNLIYSELNLLWEAWHKVFTNNLPEAIITKVQSKELLEYQDLMEKCFAENYRILKPGRWMTVEFHNSKNSVWNAIQEAILKVGFVVANVKTLNKQQGSFNQVSSTTAVKQDLIISAYKPKTSFVQRFLTEAGTEEGVWDFIRQHLSKLPIIVENYGMLDVIPERQNYLLYDSMVAFHIQKGATVPLGAADFYLGLKQRFPERDGMYFLPGQVSIYDAKRITQELNEQLSLFVLDEKTAIQWLHKELVIPQTYQDIQPKFLQELKQLKYEAMPELRYLLEENFLQDEHGKWYVPDVNKQSDLEKLRDKKLLKEFDEYRISKGKLKVFRTEAIRAGFKHCWKEKDYKTIVNISERMPEAVVQEDPSILMYYDNALTRIGD